MIPLDTPPGTKVWLRVPVYITICEAEVLALAGNQFAVRHLDWSGNPTTAVIDPFRLYLNETEACADALVDGLVEVHKQIDSLQTLRNRLASLRLKSIAVEASKES